MRTTCWLLTATFLVLVQGHLSGQGEAAGKDGSAQAEMRIWTDASGREILASLSGFKDEKTLILSLGDGRTVPYPIDKLSASDQKFAREAFARKAKENPVVVEIDWENPTQSENYVIRTVRREQAPGFILTKDGWEDEGECVQVRVQYKGEEDSASGNIGAYFYTREGKLLEEFKAPPKRKDDGDVYVDPPKSFEKGKMVEVYFPISYALKESGFRTVVIVFGTGSDYSVEAMPSSSFETLAFPEKKHVFPGWTENAGDGKSSSE